MYVTNIWFTQDSRPHGPNREDQFQIDYISAISRYWNCVRNVKVYPGADVDSFCCETEENSES